ncbi:diguanylate cyclase (GGDEF)-like protein/PAS domain S-box-containing protein [Devosia subaequoris]|uniref:Diguanylate cyclase (GGDEF)-like protein/PAS domain S-box-containing protein n=1 Tax=Devosia subaequoris TaxID=395930 RepID=A0A7W6IN42_9HYPH|nr:GGDEF and EAL domain-containing protein [Devosia subaequoris]MBB4052161.1 diguanylate cyclase (GGDEF)-like protein/PAS domain S-box-containing protein [Devosia subaequoris]MCP1209325.1 EAL domain-containing protein [Devosia subaequoris]
MSSAMSIGGTPLEFDQDVATLARLLDQAPLPSYILDLQGTVLFANQPGDALLGYGDQGCLGLNLESVVYPPDLDEARWLAEGLLEGRRPAYRAEHRLVDANGRCFWAAISLSLLNDRAGAPKYLWLQTADIDEQRTAALELADAEKRWSFALESAGQGVWESDLRAGRVYYSPTWKRLRGYEPDEEVDGSREAWLKRVHPLDLERVKIHILKADQLPRNVFEYRERHRNGHYIWIQSRGAPVEFDTNGRPIRFIGTDTDVTELKRSEALSQSLAKRLELALTVSHIGVFEYDVTTGGLEYDQRLREIYGYSPARALSSADFERAVHPEDLAGVLAANAELLRRKGEHSSSFRILRSDGEIRTLTSHVTYSEDEEGRPRIIGTSWDITDDVRMHEDLLAANRLAEARNAELQIAKDQIEKQALTDPLTELPNRRFLEKILGDLERDRQFQTSILHLDLDNFKEINDSAGHLAGDAVLRHAAGIVSSQVSSAQFVARSGGDEFVIVCPGKCTIEDLQQLAQNILDALSQPFNFQGQPFRLGASIGIACQNRGELKLNRLLGDSDAALYRAKAAGGGRYEVFTAELRTELEVARRTAEEVLDAIEHRRFVPFYQPIIDARTQEVVSLEALARWHHSEQGMLPPARFMKAAEDRQVLSIIDGMILEQAVADMRSWREQGVPIPSVSVNVSFNRLADEHLLCALKKLDFEPGTLSFELLESIFLDDEKDDFSANIEGIRKMGIGIDIDDFGTGHTSFLSLFRLNPRRFKIDRQLVQPIIESQEKRAVVSSIIGMGKTLGLKVVAEGVETQTHANLLRRLGCDYLQGYAFARPLPAGELLPWMREWDNNRR